MKKKLAATLSVVLILGLAVLGILAYLTDYDSNVNVMTLGNVDIEQNEYDVNGKEVKPDNDDISNFGDLYPGTEVVKTVKVTNVGKSEAYVRTWVAFEAPMTHITPTWAEGVTAELYGNAEIEGQEYEIYSITYDKALAKDATVGSLVSVAMSKDATNEDMAALGNDQYKVLVYSQAVQTAGFDDAVTALNAAFGTEHPWAPKEDIWDGTADTSWYNDTDTEFTLNTAEQLAGLAELVSGDTTFAGKTIKLDADIDLYCEDTSASADGDPVTFRPIGDHSKGGTFEGTFDGNGKTISNLYQNGWDLGYEWGVYGSYGLFGNVNNATIKNLTITGSESYIEGGDVAGVTGSATGTCVFENITIKDSDIATYNNGCGGIIGWSGEGNYTFKNITIEEDVSLAGLWGSFDSSIGGIVGQGEPGATYNFENVNVACRIDAYNDCTASYDYYNYRMCGMLIGRLEETTTIDGANYPDTSKYDINCNDVTVTYGDWANYHYCRAEGARAARVEAGYAYDGIAADYDHSVCTVHHMELIEFDQIFGGDQFGVKGLKAYDGVTVVYDNK